MDKRIACFTLDIEPDLRDPQRRVRLLEDDGLMERFSAIVDAYGIRVTGFLVTSLLERYGPAIGRLSQHIPIEFDLHSHDHDHRDTGSREQIEKALRVYRAFFGATPIGYRAPFGLINRAGIHNLMDLGFQYDASVIPSIRLDEYGYSNLRLPNEPFLYQRGASSLVELPLTCLRVIRLAFCLSYVKLLGIRLYRVLMALFPLSDVVVFGMHPYDFYVPLIAHHTKGWKRLAHLSNAHRAFDVLEWIARMVKSEGYEFAFMSELTERVRAMPQVLSIPL